MFGHDSQPSLIYSYGASAPHEGRDLVDQQFRLANRYRNALCEIELRRRERVDNAVREFSPRLAEVETLIAETEATLETIRGEIKAANAKARGKVDDPLRKARAKELRNTLKQLRAERKELRADAFSADSPLKATLKRIDDDSYAEQKAAYKTFGDEGLGWGTRLAVGQSCGSFRSGAPPRCKRYDGTGRIAVQLQGGLSVEDALAGYDTRLRITRSADALSPRELGARSYVHVWLRIGSQGREPVWAKLGVVFHRPLPDDAAIKWVYLHRYPRADRDEWKLSVVISREDGWAKPDNSFSGACGVDVGWRMVDAGLRVAYWVGDDGASGELIIPHADVSRWSKAESLTGIIDREFNAARDRLADWLLTNASGVRVDDGNWAAILSATEHIRQWRSVERLERVIVRWRDQRFDGDSEIFAAMEAWRKQSKHLRIWRDNQRSKAINWRDNLYRNFAAMLTRRYHTVAVEDANWSNLARLKPAELEDASDAASREYRRVASVGRLIQVLSERASSVLRVDSKHTTKRCHACGELEEFDAAVELVHTCGYCSDCWDQDANAALNLLSAAASAPVA